VFGFFKSAKTPAATEKPPEPAGATWAQRLKQGLSKTRNLLNTPVGDLFSRHPKIDEELYEELETILLTADVGVEATQHLLDQLRQRVKRDKLTEASQIGRAHV
jgi:fused signal recognition particle receptor